MEFYFFIHQIAHSLEYLKEGFQQFTSKAYRVIPQNSRASRDLLAECAAEADALESRFSGKLVYQKVTLKRIAALFKALELAQQRLFLLTRATDFIEVGEIIPDRIWALQGLAWRNFNAIRSIIAGKSALPLTLAVPIPLETGEMNLPGLLAKETQLRRETHQILEKILEFCDQDQELVSRLFFIRKDLVDFRSFPKRQREEIAEAVPVLASQA